MKTKTLLFLALLLLPIMIQTAQAEEQTTQDYWIIVEEQIVYLDDPLGAYTYDIDEKLRYVSTVQFEIKNNRGVLQVSLHGEDRYGNYQAEVIWNNNMATGSYDSQHRYSQVDSLTFVHQRSTDYVVFELRYKKWFIWRWWHLPFPFLMFFVIGLRWWNQ